jgi:hypothetical protein
MISPQQTKFIELRAKGFSLTQIATELNVCKRTLVNWGHKLQAELQEQHALEQEAFREQLIGFREQRLRRQGELLARVEAELEKRSLTDLSTARLFTMAESLRRQILNETTSTLPPMRMPAEQAIQAGEYMPGVARTISHQQSSVSSLHAVIENTPLLHEAKDQCKNGATSVQPSTDLIPSPASEDEGSNGEESIHAKPTIAETSAASTQAPLAQSAPIINRQSTINSLPDIQPLFKHRVLTEDLGRELRLHYACAK